MNLAYRLASSQDIRPYASGADTSADPNILRGYDIPNLMSSTKHSTYLTVRESK